MRRRALRAFATAMSCLAFICALAITATPGSAESPATKDQPQDAKGDALATQINALLSALKQYKTSHSDIAAKLIEALSDQECIATHSTDCLDNYVKMIADAVATMPADARNKFKSPLDALRELAKVRVKDEGDGNGAKEEKLYLNILGAYFGAIDDIGAVIEGLGRFAPGDTRRFPDPKDLRAKGFDEIDTDRVRVTPAVELEGLAGERFCSASRTIRALCQGKDKCLESTDTAAAPLALTGLNLCGYEPAPYADRRSRALVVVYQCVSKDRYNSDHLATRQLPHWIEATANERKQRATLEVDAAEKQRKADKARTEAELAQKEADRTDLTPEQKTAAESKAREARAKADAAQDAADDARRVLEREPKPLTQRWIVRRTGEYGILSCKTAAADSPGTPAGTGPEAGATKPEK